MSAAVAEPIVIQEQKVEQQKVAEQKTIAVQEKPILAAPRAETGITDHPLLPVAIALILAAIGSVAFVATIVFWLAVRHSGVVAP